MTDTPIATISHENGTDILTFRASDKILGAGDVEQFKALVEGYSQAEKGRLESRRLIIEMENINGSELSHEMLDALRDTHLTLNVRGDQLILADIPEALYTSLERAHFDTFMNLHPDQKAADIIAAPAQKAVA